MWLQTRLLSTRLEQVPSQTKKSCIALNIKVKIIKLIPVLLAGAIKTGFNFIIFHFDPRKAVYNTML